MTPAIHLAITTDIMIRFNLLNAWDINCGWCEEWAKDAQSRVGGQVLWLDEIPEYMNCFGKDSSILSAEESFLKKLVKKFSFKKEPLHYHAVLLWNGRYYDSLHLAGVDSILDLNFVKGLSREDFLDYYPTGLILE